MKKIYTKKVVGYVVGDDHYCEDCWNEYLTERDMTGKVSIDEEVWEHQLVSGEVGKVEGGELTCSRCGRVFGPLEPWEERRMPIHE
jgi:hypothetical protein